MYGAQNHAVAGQALGQIKSDRPMNRIESNLEDLNRAAESIEHSISRLMQYATALGYFNPEPQPPQTSPINGRAANIHEATQRLVRWSEILSSSLNVFD